MGGAGARCDGGNGAPPKSPTLSEPLSQLREQQAATGAPIARAGVIPLDHAAIERGTERVLAAYSRILQRIPIGVAPEDYAEWSKRGDRDASRAADLRAWFTIQADNVKKVGGGYVLQGEPFMEFAAMTPFYDYPDFRDVRGHPIEVKVIPVLVYRASTPMLFLDAYVRSEGRRVRDFAFIWVRVNVNSPEIEELRDHPEFLVLRFTSVFLHELTHVRDIIRDKDVIDPAGGDYDAYVNSPHEVRAHLQQIVADVVYLARYDRRTRQSETNEQLVSETLGLSRTWNKIDPHLTTENRNLILGAVYRALDKEGLLLGR